MIEVIAYTNIFGITSGEAVFVGAEVDLKSLDEALKREHERLGTFVI